MVNSDGNPELESVHPPERMVPAGLLWLEATHPAIFTPVALERGGMTQIMFLTPDGMPVANAIRTVSAYDDGEVHIQDEIFPAGLPQFNYELDADGRLINHPTSTSFSDAMQEIVARLRALAHQTGASIHAAHRDYGLESHFVSDGTQWVDLRSGQPIAPIPPLLLASGRPALG